MKAITHDLFSLGVGLYLVCHVEQQLTPPLLILVAWLAFATNEFIDVLGHFTKGGRPVRSLWTHSVFTAPAWGIAIALASAYLLAMVTGRAVAPPQVVLLAGLGAALAFSHLLLDALTEGGVYIARQRVALAHMRYDNSVLNAVFLALGVLLAYAAFV